MAYETLIVEVENHVALIRLNRPDALNALNTQLLGELADALSKLTRGMGLYATILEAHPELSNEDLTAEEGMWAVLLWQKILELQQKPIPESFALKALWERHQGLLPELEQRFNRLGL